VVDAINAACNHCGENLYDHYYAGRTEEETEEFILAENTRLKRKKNRADRQRRERDNQSTPQEESMLSKEFILGLLKELKEVAVSDPAATVQVVVGLFLCLWILWWVGAIAYHVTGLDEYWPVSEAEVQAREVRAKRLRATRLKKAEMLAAKAALQQRKSNFPPSQVWFRDFIDEVKNSLPENANQALVKLRWIEANKRLCSAEAGLFGADNRWHVKDWVGSVSGINLVDSGEQLAFKVSLRHRGNRILDGNLSKELWSVAFTTDTGETNFLSDSRPSSLVKFSGSFDKGDMAGDNECLDAFDIDDTPFLHDKSFYFKFKKIEIIE